MRRGQFLLGFLSACALVTVVALVAGLWRAREEVREARERERQEREVGLACHGALMACGGAVERCYGAAK